MEKFSLTDIKKMNYSDVYHYIYSNERSSKQSIASALQMSLPTVTQHLNALLTDELIEKCGQLKSQIGRKAIAYSILPQAHIAVGVEILRSKIVMIAIDLYGAMIEKKKVALKFSNNGEYYKNVCIEVTSFIGSLGFDEKTILGIGFALQGLVSEDGKTVIYGKILDCTGVTIDVFKQHLNFPCHLIHDAECAAESELWIQPDITDAIYLSLGHHLGGAIIVDGSIHSGRTGRSGTFEHMTLFPNGEKCYCGQRGCMECYCSANALLEEEEELEDFFEQKKNGNPERIAKWNTFLQNLALAINNLHMTFDSQIILGGHIAPYFDQEDLVFLHKQIQCITAFPETDTFINIGQSKHNVVSAGAALPYIKSYLENI